MGGLGGNRIAIEIKDRTEKLDKNVATRKQRTASSREPTTRGTKQGVRSEAPRAGGRGCR